MRTKTPVADSNPPPLPPHQLCSDWFPHRIQLRSCWEGKKNTIQNTFGVLTENNQKTLNGHKSHKGNPCLSCRFVTLISQKTNVMSYELWRRRACRLPLYYVCLLSFKSLKIMHRGASIVNKAPHISLRGMNKETPTVPLSSHLCVTLCRNMGSAPLTNPSWLQPIIHQSRQAAVGGTWRQC